MIGRHNGAMSVSAKMDRGEDCLFSCQAIVLSDCGAELVCNPALSSWGVSLLPLTCSDWLMSVELNFLARIYTFRSSPTPSKKSHLLCHWPFH